MKARPVGARARTGFWMVYGLNINGILADRVFVGFWVFKVYVVFTTFG
jgi:hypothetical protein